MHKIDAEQLRKWKASQEEYNRILLEERRRTTYPSRLRSLIHIWSQAAILQRPEAANTYDMGVNDTWQKLRRAYFEHKA